MTNVEYIGFLEPNGYGFATRNYVLALSKLPQLNIRLVPLGNPAHQNIARNAYAALQALQNTPECPNAIQVLHCIPDHFRRIARKTKSITIGTFEATPLPKHWLEPLKSVQRILIPSSFNLSQFSAIGPTSIVPHCLDFNDYRLDIEPLFHFDKFTFFFCGDWKERKGYKTLLQAWKDHFASNNDVQLVIKCVPKDAKRIENDLQGYSITGKNITLLSEIYPDDKMPSLFKSFDCLVNCSVGEAFGLPGLQSLSVGVPIITTDYSGMQEYVTASNSYLLKVEGFRTLSAPMDNYFQFQDCLWPYVSPEQLAEKMRVAVLENAAKKKSVGQDWQNLSRRFGYDEIGRKFLQEIENVSMLE